MADLEMIDRRIDKAQKNAKGGDKRFNHEADVFTALRDYMNERQPRTHASSARTTMRAMIATSDLLTLRKHIIYAANLGENEVNTAESSNALHGGQKACRVRGQSGASHLRKARGRTLPSWTILRKKPMFMEELGLQESGLDRLIQCMLRVCWVLFPS